MVLVPTKRTAQYIEQSVNHVIMLKTYVSAIKKVYQALGAAQSELLATIREVSQHSRKPFARITAYL
jgi:DNA mismatch repair protein MSH4